MSLRKILLKLVVKLLLSLYRDMKKALGCSGELYRFGSEEIQKCGHLVLPYLPANFGPTFFCKIVRIKWTWESIDDVSSVYPQRQGQM